MAEPAKKPVYDDDLSEKAITRPDLKKLEGGGQTTPRATGHLQAVGSDSGKKVSPDGLKEKEETGAGAATGTAAGSQEQSSFTYSGDKSDGKPGIASRLLKRKSKGKSKGKLFLLLFGGLGGLGIIGLILLLISLFGAFQYIHFATVLRSAGFARFTDMMRDEYSQDIFDTAVLDANSTGSFERNLVGDRSIFDYIRGINPEQQLIELGRTGDVEFRFTGGKDWLHRTTNTFEGVTIKTDANPEGTFYNLDSYAERFGASSYDSLGVIQKLQAQNALSSDVRDSLSQITGTDSRDVLAALKGMEGPFDFSLTGFGNWWRQLFGEKPAEVRAEVDEHANDAVTDGAPPIESGDNNADSDAEDVQKQVEAKIKDGQGVDGEAIVADQTNTAKLASAAQDAKNVSTIVLITTTYCVVRDLVNAAPNIDHQNQKQSVREAALVQSRSDQMRAGDVNSEVVGAATDGITGADQATLYQQDSGQPIPSDQADVQKLMPLNSASYLSGVTNIFTEVDNAFSVPLLGDIPGIGSIIKLGETKIKDVVCEAVLTPEVQIGTAAAEVIVSIGTTGGEESTWAEAFQTGLSRIASGEGTGEALGQGAKFAALYGGLDFAGKLLDGFVKSLSGQDYSGVAQGANLYNQSHVGTNYMEQISNRQNAYGQPITVPQAAAEDSQALDNTRAEYAKGSFEERYFSIDNPYSLLGTMSADLPTGLASFAQSIIAQPLSVAAKMFSGLMNFQSLFSTIFGRQAKVLAATSSVDAANDYFGVQQWGWTPDQLQQMQTDPSFSLVNNSNYVEANYDRLKGDYAKCYGTIDPETANNADNDVPDGCTSDYLSQPDALHWRKYMLDKSIAMDLSSNLSVSGN